MSNNPRRVQHPKTLPPTPTLKSAPGIDMPNEFIDFDSNGILGRPEKGMTLEQCVEIGKENKWSNVGFREYGDEVNSDFSHTCFVTGTPYQDVSGFVESGGLPHDVGNHVTVDLEGPIKTAPGFPAQVASFTDFDSNGVLGNTEKGMSLEDCVSVGLRNNWKNVGYRQAAVGDIGQTCFITGDTNYNTREFVENGGLPYDAGNHITVDLSGVANS